MPKTALKSDLNAAARLYFEEPSEQTLAAVAESGRGLIRYFIQLYGSPPPLREDLAQAGSAALLRALRQFDPEAGASFVTYAAHCIMGEIRHALRRERAYYCPAVIADLRSRVDRAIDRHLGETGELPTEELLARQLNVKPEAIGEAMKASLVSWDQVDVAKISSERYESFKLPLEDRIVLQEALHKLSKLQYKVIYALFFTGMSQREVSQLHDIHPRTVSRLLQSGLKALREAMLP